MEPLSGSRAMPITLQWLESCIAPLDWQRCSGLARLPAAASVDRAGRPKYQPGSRCRLSLNGVLLRLAESDTLLGVGHLHRGFRASL